jgi:hypothetical protein
MSLNYRVFHKANRKNQSSSLALEIPSKITNKINKK